MTFLLIYNTTFCYSEVKVIAKTVTDVKPVNGYLDYPGSMTSRVVSITTVDNKLPEESKTFSMILASSSGGASIDRFSNSRTKLIGKLKRIF